MSIYQKLAQIQQNLKAPKNQFNKFGNYAYRSCEDILEGLKTVIGDLVVIIEDDIQLIGDRIYVKATVTLTDGKDSIKNSAFARESLTKKGMDESQITGATSSYARKYALNGMFLIDDTKDADSMDNRNNQQQNQKPVYTQACLDRDLRNIMDAIAGGTKPEQVIKQLESQGLFVPKDIKQSIFNLPIPLSA